MLEDGTYDAIVVDAQDADDGAATVELSILAGAHKGEVISLHTATWSGTVIDLLGIPATITVTDSQPVVRFEP